MRVRFVAVVAIALLVAGSVAFAQQQGRTERIELSLPESNWFVGACSPTVDVFVKAALQVRVTLYYDESGNVVLKELDKVKPGPTVLFLGDHETQEPINDNTVKGSPGQNENDRYIFADDRDYITGIPFKVVVPGLGRVYSDPGRMVWAISTNTLLAYSGWNGNSASDIAALCDYLK